MSVMAEEITEIPAVLRRLLSDGRNEVEAVARLIRHRFRRAVFVARGTSDHAAVYGRYLFETELGVPGALAAPAVTTIYGSSIDWSDALVVAVSQSGHSPDLISVVDDARAGGATSLAITNDTRSPLALAAELVIDVRAGREQAVPATKTYVAELAALAMLVAALAEDVSLVEELQPVPGLIDRWLETGDIEIGGMLSSVTAAAGVLVLARGFNLATAQEIALKLTETCGVLAHGYSTADFEHGPIVLTDTGHPVIVLHPDGASSDHIRDVIVRLRTGLGPVWVIGTGPDADIVVPGDLSERVSPLALVVPGLVLAERAARLRGADPDAPRSLQKVTQTL